MAHQIDFSTGRAAMAYVGETPWWGGGQKLHPNENIENWQVAAGMNWRILRSRVRYMAGPDETAPLMLWGDKHVLFRSDTHAPLGVVSDKYKVVQPKEVLEFFRDLVADAGFTLETAGCLFDGRRFWALARVTADVGMVDGRDRVGGFLLLSTGADGMLATSARFTTVRVVCNNTLSVALGTGAGRKQSRGDGIFTLPHSATFDPLAAKAHLGLAKPDEVRNGFESAMDMLRRLASRTITPLDVADATLRLAGHDPSTMTSDEIAKAAKGRVVQAIGNMAVTGEGLMGADLRGGHGTAWGWLNAVTQYVDHNAGRAGRDAAGAVAAQNRRLDSAWFGQGDALKRRALLIAQQMADGTTEFVERQQTDAEFGADVLAAALDTQGAA